jgi:chromosomal replication initiation ATPase DnaA
MAKGTSEILQLREMLEELVKPWRKESANWDTVVECAKGLVREYFRLSRDDLALRSKAEHIVWPRFHAMRVARDFTPLSLDQIGRRFRLGDRLMDHGNVLHGLRALKERAEVCGQTRATVERLADRFAMLTGLRQIKH